MTLQQCMRNERAISQMNATEKMGSQWAISHIFAAKALLVLGIVVVYNGFTQEQIDYNEKALAILNQHCAPSAAASAAAQTIDPVVADAMRTRSDLKGNLAVALFNDGQFSRSRLLFEEAARDMESFGSVFATAKDTAEKNVAAIDGAEGHYHKQLEVLERVVETMKKNFRLCTT